MRRSAASPRTTHAFREWKLPVLICRRTRGGRDRKIDWYAMRPENRETLAKTRSPAARPKSRTAHSQPVDSIAIFCILAWRVFWLTEINRSAPEAPPEVVLTGNLNSTLLTSLSHTARTAQGASPVSQFIARPTGGGKVSHGVKRFPPGTVESGAVRNALSSYRTRIPHWGVKIENHLAGLPPPPRGAAG